MKKPQTIFLLTRNVSDLPMLRGIFSNMGYPVVSCCSVGALVSACEKNAGCVVISARDYTNDKIRGVVESLRQKKLPHAAIVMDTAPSLQRALEILRMQVVCDYVQMSTSAEQLWPILVEAMRWGETNGERVVWTMTVRETWETLDEGLRKIMRLLYSGKTNREIASEMKVSQRTIETRRARLFESFQATTFVEFIRAASVVMEE